MGAAAATRERDGAEATCAGAIGAGMTASPSAPGMIDKGAFAPTGAAPAAGLALFADVAGRALRGAGAAAVACAPAAAD